MAKLSFPGGFQLLHAVHAVEAFLQKLRERECNFHLVWFDDHSTLSSPGNKPGDQLNSRYALTRAVLVRHLQQTCADPASQGNAFSFTFPSLDHAAFQDYLAQNALHFFLCLDPQTFPDCSPEWFQSYLGIAHWFGTKNYSLAFINGIEFVSSKVQCSVVAPSSSWSEYPLLAAKAPEDAAREASLTLLDEDDITKNWAPWKDGRGLTSREATALYALCELARTHAEEPHNFCSWAAAYINHLVLLRRLPLSLRSVDEVDVPDEESMLHMTAEFSNVCASALSKVPTKFSWDSFDLLDGRLLRFIAAKQPNLPQDLTLEAAEFGSKIKQVTGIDIQASVPSFGSVCSENGHSTPSALPNSSVSGSSVLPFSHPALDSYLQDVQVAATSKPQKQQLPKIYKELAHWHNARVSIAVKRPPRPKDKWQRRLDQKFMATYIQYSASLTNVSGKAITPEIIVVDDEETTRKAANAAAKQSKSAASDKQAAGTKAKQAKPVPVRNKNNKAKSGREVALETAGALREEKLERLSNTAIAAWEAQCKIFEQERNLVVRYRKVMKYLGDLSNESKRAVGFDVAVYSGNVLALMLAKTAAASHESARISALIWSTVQDLSKQSVSPSSAKLFYALANAVGFPTEALDKAESTSSARRLPYQSVLDKDAPFASLQQSTVDFQLQHCGPFLERSFDPAPDSRVPFIPDAWQRNVLDAIDADKSLLVVAPTSAGKTFISFYAMKKVLKNSDDGVLVYVAPTKALVNQIAAEIQARFSKRYNSTGSVWAIHTRDYRINNPTGCQVLVTVPDILQIMLMAPSNAEQPNSWARRVKRIIFDEVHCIGQADDGVVWEQLLLLAPCPIIALSATVGNPLEFQGWLEDSEKAKGNEMEMIVHSTRYSDLRKFLWKPHDNGTFDGFQTVERLPIPGLDDTSESATRFSYIHPVASLINRDRGTIQDLSLEPRDCATLWASMAKHQNDEFPLDLSLDPTKALPSSVGKIASTGKTGYVVRKADVARYEAKLKDTLEVWMADRRSPFEAVQNDLRSRCEVPRFATGDLPKHALSLLTDLHTQGALPAILFNYDRVSCEEIGFGLLSELVAAEQEFKATSPEWKSKVTKFERWKKDGSKMRVLQEKAAKAKAKGKKDDDDVEKGRMEDDPSTWASFDPQAPLSMFSFGDETKYSASELESTIWSLRWKNLDPRLIECLKRGIGIHHAGMNHKYRQVVEMLFRKGYLTAVISTGTLALGLNMPCKTVVFYGDSVSLTALNYHQAAGRAGRRGFDLLGNVVFAGMTQERAYEIMSSRLPDLRGHFPLSTTLVLRSLGLMHHTKNSDYSVRAIQSLLSQTRLYLGGPSNHMAIKHHLRFSIEYLRRQHLLDEAGAPLNFAGLVGHLYFTENSVFAFHALLKEGYFHGLCAEYRESSEETLRKIVLVLSHIFCRIPVGDISKTWEETIDASPSMVRLPSLPEEALQILRSHNSDTLGIFTDYARTFVDQHLGDTPDRSLPFTKLDAGAGEGGLSGASVQQILGEDAQPPTKVRSPFAALSGFDDDSIRSVHELCTTIRSGVFLEEDAIPHISLYPDDNDGRPWNAYIWDF